MAVTKRRDTRFINQLPREKEDGINRSSSGLCGIVQPLGSAAEEIPPQVTGSGPTRLVRI